MKGYRTTWGAQPFENQMLDVDAAVVERLDGAGAVLVAKLTTGELAFGDNWFGGRTNNRTRSGTTSGKSSLQVLTFGPSRTTGARGS